MSAAAGPGRRPVWDPKSTVLPWCGWDIRELTPTLARRRHSDFGKSRVKEQALVVYSIHRGGYEGAPIRFSRLQGVGDGVRQRGMRADFDEGSVVLPGG